MTDTIARPRPAWPRWTFRIVATIAAILLYAQSVTAGMFIPDHQAHAAFETHGTMAFVAAIAVLLLLVAGILIAASGGGALPVVTAAVLLVLVAGEIAAGVLEVVPLHIPLGVGIIAVATVTAVASWLPSRRSRAVAAA
jgi:hypothetical protein